MTAAIEKETQIPNLLPERHIIWSDPVQIALDDLPANQWLVGPPPTKDLIDLIRSYGQWEPVQLARETVGLTSQYPYLVIGGRRRIKALRLLAAQFPEDARFKTVKAVVREDDQGGLTALLDLASNQARKDNPLSGFLAIRNALREMGEDDGAPTIGALTAISRATGTPYQTLVKTMALVKLERRLLEAAEAGHISVTNAHKLAKLPPEQQRAIADAMEDGETITGEVIREATRARSSDALASVQLLVKDAKSGVTPETGSIESYLVGKLNLAMHEAGAVQKGPGTWEAGGRWYTIKLNVEVSGGA